MSHGCTGRRCITLKGPGCADMPATLLQANRHACPPFSIGTTDHGGAAHVCGSRLREHAGDDFKRSLRADPCLALHWLRSVLR